MARPKLKKMTTKEAFESLLQDQEFYLSLDPGKRSTFRAYRKRLADGENLSIEKMEKILEANGFRVYQPKLWVK